MKIGYLVTANVNTILAEWFKLDFNLVNSKEEKNMINVSWSEIDVQTNYIFHNSILLPEMASIPNLKTTIWHFGCYNNLSKNYHFPQGGLQLYHNQYDSHSAAADQLESFKMCNIFNN
jgi:hypothetical protein